VNVWTRPENRDVSFPRGCAGYMLLPAERLYPALGLSIERDNEGVERIN
jgi:hypothetical protein